MTSTFTHDPTILARCRGVGVLSRQDAIRSDLRRDTAYLAYDEVKFTVPVQTEGDVLARVVVRALEIVESCAAARLGLKRTTLQSRIRKYDITRQFR